MSNDKILYMGCCEWYQGSTMHVLMRSETRKYGESTSMTGRLTQAAKQLAVNHSIPSSDLQDPTRPVMSKLALVLFRIHSRRF
ncbi:hypothetical protein PHSY_000328 [Pseudozyma hubeiensis SY62]|uniref:Uncharacterized protein n=1 Tax=Pseudozyma hubeiensis (strain SY62) TaxID=1305764 RepID=R9NWD0_PSEHS|nr:hypothetical protein PHSY_000328 [Pseudozyma hubeiensis SY62]GAC92772.1 hypothetical protein PHSY_000328 [Pseudozyma hubeiensis SY62]